MTSSDGFGEGMGYLLLFVGFFLVVFGTLELAVICSLLKRTTRRSIRLGVPAVLLGAGFLLLMRLDAPLVIFGSIVLVAPAAALLPTLVIPGPGDPGPDRILVNYITVAVFNAGLLFVFMLSGLSMDPGIFWHTPLSNAIIFACVLLLDTLFALLVYRIMQGIRPVIPADTGNTGSDLYVDSLVRISNDSITFLHYSFPLLSPRRVLFADIDHISVKEPSLFTGKWRIWGSGDLRTWYPLDTGRPSRDRIFHVTLKTRGMNIGFTAEHSVRVFSLLREKGLLLHETGTYI